MSPDSGWTSKLKRLPKIHAKGNFHRMVRLEDAEGILSTGPSFTYGGRYNKAGEFGPLYLSENPDICEKEKLRQAAGQLLPLQAMGTIEIDINDVLDLTDEGNIKALGIFGRDLVDLVDLTLPSGIAESARAAGIKGLLVLRPIHNRHFGGSALERQQGATSEDSRSYLSEEQRSRRPKMSPGRFCYGRFLICRINVAPRRRVDEIIGQRGACPKEATIPADQIETEAFG